MSDDLQLVTTNLKNNIFLSTFKMTTTTTRTPTQQQQQQHTQQPQQHVCHTLRCWTILAKFDAGMDKKCINCAKLQFHQFTWLTTFSKIIHKFNESATLFIGICTFFLNCNIQINVKFNLPCISCSACSLIWWRIIVKNKKTRLVFNSFRVNYYNLCRVLCKQL